MTKKGIPTDDPNVMRLPVEFTPSSDGTTPDIKALDDWHRGNECHHRRVVIDLKTREVVCGDCKVSVDPLQALLEIGTWIKRQEMRYEEFNRHVRESQLASDVHLVRVKVHEKYGSIHGNLIGYGGDSKSGMPVRSAGHGFTWTDEADPTAEGHFSMYKPDGWRWMTEAEADELSASSEPSKVIAGWLGLPYQKYLDPDPGSQINVVELVADGDCAADQPCAFGHRVEDYAVYCHNSRWIDAPRKCHRRQPEWPHEECPGFVVNPRLPVASTSPETK